VSFGTGLDGSLISTFGEVVGFTPNGSSDEPEEVLVIREDPISGANNALLVLFGTMADSGFSQMPAKNDTFTVDDVEYRAFEVSPPDAIGGIFISLKK
jgi:hypothetical protein